eukprot:gene15147-16704_t
MENFTPKTCCIKTDPPTLVLFYINDKGKLHRRSIPVRDIKENTSIDEIKQDLMQTHHGKYLKRIKENQLNRLLKKLQDGVCNIGIASESKTNYESENLNKLNDEELNAVKEKMSEGFEKHRIKPGDENWKYEVEVDFELNNGNKIESGWDSDGSDLEF